ncbi:MAG: phosphonate C-P lyase system protein PhnG [Pseudomonadota bacterium]
MSELNPDALSAQNDTNAARATWMKMLAESDAVQIKQLWASNPDFESLEFEIFRRPERGLVMVRARAGSAGERFNLGEMTVTRCAVRLKDGTTGVSYISGRDVDHALIAAKIDALMQTDDHSAAAEVSFVEPLVEARRAKLQNRAEKISATKVNFFTMVRNREDKK